MRFFEDLYSQYKKPYGETLSEAARDVSERIAPPPEERRVLDIGCGYGRDCILLAKKGFDVTGVDSSRRAIMSAQMFDRDEGTGVDFLNTDILDTDFEDDAFDIVLCVNTLEYMDRRKRTKIGHEIWRLLKSGGYLGLMVRSTEDTDLGEGQDMGDNTWEVYPGLPTHFFTEREIKQIFPDYRRERFETVTVTEPVPDPTQHDYWVLVGRRP